MKRLYLIVFLGLAVLGIRAQETVPSAVDSIPSTTGRLVTPVYAPSLNDSFYSDSLHLPVLNRFGQIPYYYIGMYPSLWGGYPSWYLHEGLNVNVGASVFAQFGKNAYHGAGFTQDLSMMYAAPLTKKLSMAVGGYVNNLFWMHDTFRDGGLNAVLSYRFDDHWEAYLYGQKSLVHTKMPMPLYGMSNIGDRIGAAVRYNFSPSFSIQVNVEKREYPW